jgi:hypothetical protein
MTRAHFVIAILYDWDDESNYIIIQFLEKNFAQISELGKEFEKEVTGTRYHANIFASEFICYFRLLRL